MQITGVSTNLVTASIVMLLLADGNLPKAIAAEAATLPLSKIVLYSSGVGYFQHDGTVRDRTQVDLRFNTSQINDLLKSLVVQDFGNGKVTSITYGSRDPVTKTLGSFGINLNGNPTLGAILAQVRGEQVEVTAPNLILGTLLGVEKKIESIVGATVSALRIVARVEFFTKSGSGLSAACFAPGFA